MRPIAAYQYGLKSLPRSPALVGVIVAVGIVNAILGYLPMGLMALLDQPMLGNIALFAMIPGYVFVGPAILGGLFAMTWQALDGRAGLEDFLAGVRSNYLHLLGWGIIFLGIYAAYAFVMTILAFIAFFVLMMVFGAGLMALGGAASGGASSAGLGIAAVVMLALVYLVLVVLYAVPYGIFQFVPGAIVFEEHGFVDAGKRGLGLVRQNLLPTIGFDLTIIALGVLFTVITNAALFLVVDFGAMFSTGMATAGSQTFNPYASLGVVELGGLVGLGAVTSTISGLIVIPAYAAFFRIVAKA